MAKQSKKIGERTFTVSTLPPRQAYGAAIKAAAVFGPIIAAAVKAAGPGGLASLAEDKDDGAIVRLLSEALASAGSIPQAQLDSLVEDMIGVSSIEGQGGGPLRAHFDVVFDDALDDFFVWLAFAVQVNFATFFRKAAKAAADKANAKNNVGAGASAGNVAGVATGAVEDGNAA